MIGLKFKKDVFSEKMSLNKLLITKAKSSVKDVEKAYLKLVEANKGTSLINLKKP